MRAERVWLALPLVAVVLFFAWLLSKTGEPGAGETIVRVLLGVAIVAVGGGLVFAVLRRRG